MVSRLRAWKLGGFYVTPTGVTLQYVNVWDERIACRQRPAPAGKTLLDLCLLGGKHRRNRYLRGQGDNSTKRQPMYKGLPSAGLCHLSQRDIACCSKD